MSKSEIFVPIPEESKDLEAEVYWGSGKFEEVAVIVCHPHAWLGGDMDNHVVTTLTQQMMDLGCTTIRFNFRGVGHSEGSGSIQGKSEEADVLAIANWLIEKSNQGETVGEDDSKVERN